MLPSGAPPPPEAAHEPAPGQAAASAATLVKAAPKIKSTPRTPQLTSLLKGQAKSGKGTVEASAPEAVLEEPYTEEQLRQAWDAYTGQRKKFQGEYQLLSQPYATEGHTITVELLSPVHQTMLNNVKSELTAFLRKQLRNNLIQVTGQLYSGEEKKIIYTNREKFEFLVEKNPVLKELKDRLGLDTDF